MVVRTLMFESRAKILWHVRVEGHLIVTIASGLRNLVIYKRSSRVSVDWHESQEAEVNVLINFNGRRCSQCSTSRRDVTHLQYHHFAAGMDLGPLIQRSGLVTFLTLGEGCL